MRYLLRTLMILAAVLPPILAMIWFLLLTRPELIVFSLGLLLAFSIGMFMRSLANESGSNT